MKRIKLYCCISAILCAALLLASCVSDNASKPVEPSDAGSLPAESVGDTGSYPVDVPYMLVCRSLEELSGLHSILEKGEQEVYEYLYKSGLHIMSGVRSKAELAALLEKIGDTPVMLPDAETGYVFGSMTYNVESEWLDIIYIDPLGEKYFRAESYLLPSDSQAAAESDDIEYADTLTVGELDIGLRLSEGIGTYRLYGYLEVPGHRLYISFTEETIDPNLRSGIELTTLDEVLSDFRSAR